MGCESLEPSILKTCACQVTGSCHWRCCMLRLVIVQDCCDQDGDKFKLYLEMKYVNEFMG